MREICLLLVPRYWILYIFGSGKLLWLRLPNLFLCFWLEKKASAPTGHSLNAL